MNIGVDIRCLMEKNRTGVGEYTYGLLNALFSIDYTDDKTDYTNASQYFLFYNSWTDVSQNIHKWEHENVHYVYTRWPNIFLNLLVWLKLVKLDKIILNNIKKIFKNIKYLDIFFSPNLNFTNFSKNIKHILTIHDLSFEFFSECFTWKQRLWHWFLHPRRQCRKADIILTPSENTKRDIADRYQIADNKVQVLRPGLSWNIEHGTRNMEQVKQKYNLLDKYILFLGTLEPRKNVETIIEAYKIAYSLQLTAYSLVIVGNSGWKNKKIMDLIARTPGVRYIGYAPEEDKPALYQLASLFVFPSLYEGFGLPVLEALAPGVPVITSNRSALPEVAGEAAYLVNPHNVLEVATAMKKILSDEKLRGILIGRGIKRAEEFGWGKTAEKFVRILETILV